MLRLEPDFRAALQGKDTFNDIISLKGVVYREVANRRTLRFELQGKSYFIKAHFGTGWREIFKNLFSLRLPVLGAKNEVRAIRRLEDLRIDTLKIAAYGWRGLNPALQQSFVVTEHLGDTITLEDLCLEWRTSPPLPSFKRRLIYRLAAISRRLHSHGINHRDFYLCHFHIPRDDPEGPLSLIDLHRAQLRRRVPRRWLIKDIGGLYFSAMDIGLTQRDLLRFIRDYEGRSLRMALTDNLAFWRDVEARAKKLHVSYAETIAS